MEWLNFFESNLFSNIINTFSAIGTIGAVIVSLYLSRKGERIKYKIRRQVIVPVGYCGNFSLRYDLCKKMGDMNYGNSRGAKNLGVITQYYKIRKI